ncbi:unnamed protein product [Phyllotreta striolata]|uniref:Peptidase M14 domain-containing protein n=1 Tax=Phyllotreta striolata TaxID=444603 RepID=A0A9N9TBU9_PHYSR|nr:unnamed protein product [Phyllotreta striolata]
MGDFGEDSDDSDGEGGMGNVSRIIMRPPGHSGKAKKGHLCFDASFETGNLGRVDLVNEYEYDLFIRPDTCSPKLRFWFNFTVDNVKLDQRVIFNIVNISKERNLFMENMTPLVKSTSRQQWQRIPKQYVFYHKSPLHHGHYVLSFSFGFDKEEDIFHFCLAPPYSYTKLQTFLSILEKKSLYLEQNYNREILGNSVQKRRLDLITIGSLDRNDPKSKRRVIVIMARVHPGESPSSFVCQGLLELLVSSNSVATTLREHVIFKVIPMMNPDGVFLGNYRSTVLGADLNRSWNVANEWCHPTIRAVIDMLVRIDKNKEFQLDFIIDIHANSSLKGCFIYGNSYEDVYRYERHILFPKLLANNLDDYVPENTMFNSDISKVGTARRYLCSILNDKVNCYTFEVSIYGYTTKGSEIILPYTEDNYKKCGRNLVKTFLEYYHSTGAIPLLMGSEIVQKMRKPRLADIRRRNKRRLQRPLTSRTLAALHFKNLNISDYDSSFDELTFSHRNQKITFDRFADQFNSRGESRTGGKCRNTPVSAAAMADPEPTLSIIDFNLVIRDDISACNRAKLKK